MSERLRFSIYDTVFWLPTGFRIRYAAGFLVVDDLNPEVEIRVRLTRGDMVRIGLRMIWRAITEPNHE